MGIRIRGREGGFRYDQFRRSDSSAEELVSPMVDAWQWDHSGQIPWWSAHMASLVAIWLLFALSTCPCDFFNGGLGS